VVSAGEVPPEAVAALPAFPADARSFDAGEYTYSHKSSFGGLGGCALSDGGPIGFNTGRGGVTTAQKFPNGIEQGESFALGFAKGAALEGEDAEAASWAAGAIEPLFAFSRVRILPLRRLCSSPPWTFLQGLHPR